MGEPGVTLLMSARPKSVAPPVQPRAQLSQRVVRGEEATFQTGQGRDPNSKMLSQLHSA